MEDCNIGLNLQSDRRLKVVLNLLVKKQPYASFVGEITH